MAKFEYRQFDRQFQIYFFEGDDILEIGIWGEIVNFIDILLTF